MNIEESLALIKELVSQYANGGVEDFDHHMRLLSEASMVAVKEVAKLICTREALYRKGAEYEGDLVRERDDNIELRNRVAELEALIEEAKPKLTSDYPDKEGTVERLIFPQARCIHGGNPMPWCSVCNLAKAEARFEKERSLRTEYQHRAEDAEARMSDKAYGHAGRVAELEGSIRGLIIDVPDKDGPAYRGCSACSALNVPYSFEHDEGCPAKPALDLVFGPNDADHAKESR